MKRQNPYISPSGIVLSLTFIVGLGLSIWRSGNRIFSPGNLSAQFEPGVTLGDFASHAEFEEECSRCHQPLEADQGALCIKCHQTIQGQMLEKWGTHGIIQRVQQCAACHSDHQGEDFDLTRSAYQYFYHQATKFSLVRHQVDYDTTPIDCDACHNSQANFSIELENCVTCHAQKDIKFMSEHTQNFEFECLGCHDGQDQMSGFDHQATAFPLEGRHSEATCRACHVQVLSASLMVDNPTHMLEIFRETPNYCMACHKESDLHTGEFSADCQKCHTTQAWKPAFLDGIAFDHDEQTEFSLNLHKVDYTGQVIRCSACHINDIKNFEVSSCIACHSKTEEQVIFLQSHQDLYGDTCLKCHDGRDRMHGFDHQTRFLLDGKHAELDCQECHVDKSFTGTPQACASCHAEPAIHEGYFGLKCQYCHTSQAWAPARLEIHNFPLTHGNQDGSNCETCHADSYLEYSCYNCHEHQPDAILDTHLDAGISNQILPACMDCHLDGQVHKKP